MKIFARLWNAVGSLGLRLADRLRGTVFAAFSDCADRDGKSAIELQMKYDGAGFNRTRLLLVFMVK